MRIKLAQTHTILWFLHLGDFHFLWECLRAIFTTFWGTPSQQGSLCNAREYISRRQVRQNVKVFSVGDEFMLLVFKAHLAASICTILNIGLPTDPIEHAGSIEWLRETVTTLVSKTIARSSSQDPVYAFHRSVMHMAFLYFDLRNAIRWKMGRT